MSADELSQSGAVDPYDDLAALVVMYAEHLAMLGRFTTLGAETDRIQCRLTTLRAELGADGRQPTVPTQGSLLARTDELLDDLMSVVRAGDAETDVYVNEMLPALHTLLTRIQHR
jgi:hypothetical protein